MYDAIYNFARENSYLVLGLAGILWLLVISGTFWGIADYLEKKEKKDDDK